MHIINQEEVGIIEEIALKSNSASEKVTEAIIEMNIMRQRKVSKEDLIKLIENGSY